MKNIRLVRYKHMTGLPTEFIKSPFLRMFKNKYGIGFEKKSIEMTFRSPKPWIGIIFCFHIVFQ